MYAQIIQFIVNSLFPWLIFSSCIYACTSYLTKDNNSSPSIWWAALIISFLPFLPLSFSAIKVNIPNLQYLNSSLESAQIVKQAGITHASLNNIDLISVLFIVGYLSFTSVKLVRLMIAWQQLAKISKSSKVLKDGLGYRIVVSCLNNSPFVFGVSKPQIVLPNYFLSLGKKQRNILIQHEFTHILNKDHVAVLLWKVTSSLLWINPFIKRMEWQFVRAMEHRCDRQTVNRFNINRHDYAKTLLQSLRNSAHLNEPLVAQFNSGALGADDYKIRLTNIMSLGEKKRFNLIVPFSLAMFSFISLHVFLKEMTVAQKLIWQQPLKSYEISSSFRSVDKIRAYKPHQGIDYVAKSGSTVFSAADGIVVVADNKTLNSNYGNTVLIQHKNGYQTLYSHLDSIEVTAGNWIKAGQNIGIIGSTGKATGVHLHFEVIKDNQRISPTLIFN